MSGAFHRIRVGSSEERPVIFQQFDAGLQGILLGVAERTPPIKEFIGDFDVPHNLIITYKEYWSRVISLRAVTCCRRLLGRASWLACGAVAGALLDEFGDQGGPAGLVGGAQAEAVVAVEVFGEG